MIARMNGVRAVRYGPASDAARDDRIRWRSDHCETVSAGSGASPESQASRISSAPSKSSELKLDLGKISQVFAQIFIEHLLQSVSIDAQLRSNIRSHTGRPIQPRIPLPAGQIEYRAGRLGSIDELTLHLVEPDACRLCFQHLVRHPRPEK